VGNPKGNDEGSVQKRFNSKRRLRILLLSERNVVLFRKKL
jgi:hypothetical protein